MPEHLNRHHIVAAIDGERAYVDEKHGDDAPTLPKLLDLMQSHIDKARQAFGDNRPAHEVEAMHEIRKAVSNGVLAMELYGAPRRGEPLPVEPKGDGPDPAGAQGEPGQGGEVG